MSGATQSFSHSTDSRHQESQGAPRGDRESFGEKSRAPLAHGKAPSFKSRPRSQGARVAWLPSSASPYRMSLRDLGREVADFAQYATLKPAEVMSRRTVIDRVRAIVRDELGADADTTVFGSFSFSLSLCTGDVDIAVDADHLMLPDVEVLTQLADGIDAKEFMADRVFTASVPLLKLTHRGTGALIDVTVATESTRPSVAAQTAFLAEYPAAEPIIIVMKALLRQWGLNAVASGGLSSTSLYHLVERFFLANAACPPKPSYAAAAARGADRLASPKLSRTPSSTGSDMDWRTGTQESSTTPVPTCWTPPPEPMPACPTPEENEAAGKLFLAFLKYCSNDAFAFGFGLYDRLDPTNEVSRGTTRTMELQALTKHTAAVLDMLMQPPQRGSQLPPSPLSSIAADLRAPPPPPPAAISVRVGSRAL